MPILHGIAHVQIPMLHLTHELLYCVLWVFVSSLFSKAYKRPQLKICVKVKFSGTLALSFYV